MGTAYDRLISRSSDRTAARPSHAVRIADLLSVVYYCPYRLLILQDLENKGDSFQDLQNAGVMVSLELWETQA